MQYTPYSSTVATEQIAERLFREARNKAQASQKALLQAIGPVTEHIIRTKKLPRNHLRWAMSEIEHRVSGIKHLLGVWPSYIKRNMTMVDGKAQETGHLKILTYDQTVTDPAVAEFVAFDFEITRKAIEVKVMDTDMRMITHLLARWMQRGQLPPDVFLSDVVKPMRAASMLMYSVLNQDRNSIALPTGQGLILGTVGYSPVASARRPLRYRLAAGTWEETQGDPILTMHPDYVASVTMRTFIDEDSLDEGKAALLDRLRAWEAQQHETLDRLLDGTLFGAIMIYNGETVASIKKRMQDLREASQILVTSPEWKRVLG